MNTDPFANGIKGFGIELRAGRVTIEQAVTYYLQQIEKFDPALMAYQVVDAEGAINTAKALDVLLANGTDLGPLMGVPIGVKDIITVDGLPVTNGSLYPTAHLNGREGTVVKRLRHSGCVILGKTKTVEFALGSTGINEARGTPWNPWDLKSHRLPGGSSSGSAVAVAAGLCAFALGTDTGGSIRIPACYNGLFGHKTSMGLWPTDGVFSLCTTLDSIGPICRTSADALIIHQAMTKNQPNKPVSLKGLRFAIPTPVFFDDLDPEVEAGFNVAVKELEKAGVDFINIDLPQTLERNDLFPVIVGAELIATLTVDGFAEAQSEMDSVTRSRAAVGLDVSAVDYLKAKRRHEQLKQIAADTFNEVDAWVSPTVPMLPMRISDLENAEYEQRSLLSSQNTQPGNLYGLCGATLPIQQLSGNASNLPMGFQVLMPSNADARLLAVSQAIEAAVGPGPQVDLSQLQ